MAINQSCALCVRLSLHARPPALPLGGVALLGPFLSTLRCRGARRSNLRAARPSLSLSLSPLVSSRSKPTTRLETDNQKSNHAAKAPNLDCTGLPVSLPLPPLRALSERTCPPSSGLSKRSAVGADPEIRLATYYANTRKARKHAHARLQPSQSIRTHTRARAHTHTRTHTQRPAPAWTGNMRTSTSTSTHVHVRERTRCATQLMVGLNLASFLCPSCSASISCESTPIASFDCMPRLPIAAFETVPRASLSTNSS